MALVVLVLICATLLSSRQALAQFSQQGPKLVGTGAVGGRALSKAIPCPSPPTATRPSSEEPTTTVALGPRGSGRGAEASGPSRDPSWSARAPSGTRDKATPCPSPPTATRPSSEGSATTAAWGPRGSGRGAEVSGPSRDPSWSARAPWGPLAKAFRVPLRRRQHGHRRRAFRQQLTLGPRGSGRGAEASGPSRDPSWSARAPSGRRNKATPCPSPPTATPPSSEGTPTTTSIRWGRVGLDEERRRLDPAGTQAGRLGRAWEAALQGWSVSLSADGNTAIVGGPGDNRYRWGRVGLDEERRRLDPAGTQAGRLGRRGAPLSKAVPCPSPPTATRPSSEGPRRQQLTLAWGRVGLDEERRRLDPAGNQAGRLGRRGERWPRRFRVPLRRRQHGHRRRVP